MKYILIKTFLFLLPFVFNIDSFPQSKSCDLQLEVIYNQKNNTIEEIPVKNASAILRTSNDKTTINAVLKNESPYFESVNEGKYFLDVTGKSFKTTVKQIAIDCNTADEQGVVTEIIILWKGKSKERVSMNSGDDSGGKLIKKVEPRYSDEARRAKISGVVTIRVTVDEGGNIIAAKVVRGHPLLQDMAVKAALESKFSPLIREGKAVQFTRVIAITFKIY